MENIKSNFDKIMEKFNDSMTHSAPKKLSFEYLTDSFNDSGTLPKKRRHDNSNISCDDSNASVSSIPPSPWETRRIKADLIEAKSRISKLKTEIERQHKLRAEVETLYESKVTELKKQCDFSANKVQDVEKHLQVVRKREHGAKQELLRTQRELTQLKHRYEEELHKLQRDKLEIEDHSRQMQNSMENELSEYRRHTDKLEMELQLLTDEMTNLKSVLNEYKQHSSSYETLKIEHEKEQQELEVANSRIKELEYQIASYEDWKEITKKSQTRLLSIPDMDKELERLRTNNKNLQELLGNKLLLEEQVHDLKNRLAREEGGRNEAVALQVKLSHMEQELKDWIKVAQDHCLPNMLVSPMALRSRIEQLLQNDIIMISEKRNTQSETKSIKSDLLDYKQKCEIYVKNIEELNVALKRHKNFKERIQRKLFLVSKERDCYKQLLENFEKDLTFSNANHAVDGGNGDVQLRSRLDMLEKTLVGYKDMCSNLEKELTNAKQLPVADQSIENVISTETYEHIKKELDTMRLENERLRRRKEELELELEHRCLKGDFNVGKFKVVHLAQNPAAEAYENSNNLIEKLQAEIERLKRRNKKLEEDNEVTQARMNETTNMTINIKEMNQLRAELEATNSKMKKMKECYKSASMEFREVCYLLFGYRVDRLGLNTNYKLSSMYAESPDDYLNFRLNESNNALDMLETPYSITLKPFIESQLVGNKSLPAFLSALTLELFQRSTMTMS
ncbi:mitotic spindle assembly checkpoint protein MAD1 [Bactrocera dorsalis]|uniref:Mitotic spindle assembly checkpoint protein MAD1 n=1 Tax=Bactrocera dorsalis TaxID=27457 RepID=A0A034VD87_BACDO|nr:mitotic spindle assembly checkpoint protein MAD1 [Bactrocera dorsalis]